MLTHAKEISASQNHLREALKILALIICTKTGLTPANMLEEDRNLALLRIEEKDFRFFSLLILMHAKNYACLPIDTSKSPDTIWRGIILAAETGYSLLEKPSGRNCVIQLTKNGLDLIGSELVTVDIPILQKFFDDLHLLKKFNTIPDRKFADYKNPTTLDYSLLGLSLMIDKYNKENGKDEDTISFADVKKYFEEIVTILKSFMPKKPSTKFMGFRDFWSNIPKYNSVYTYRITTGINTRRDDLIFHGLLRGGEKQVDLLKRFIESKFPGPYPWPSVTMRESAALLRSSKLSDIFTEEKSVPDAQEATSMFPEFKF